MTGLNNFRSSFDHPAFPDIKPENANSLGETASRVVRWVEQVIGSTSGSRQAAWQEAMREVYEQIVVAHDPPQRDDIPRLDPEIISNRISLLVSEVYSIMTNKGRIIRLEGMVIESDMDAYMRSLGITAEEEKVEAKKKTS